MLWISISGTGSISIAFQFPVTAVSCSLSYQSSIISGKKLRWIHVIAPLLCMMLIERYFSFDFYRLKLTFTFKLKCEVLKWPNLNPVTLTNAFLVALKQSNNNSLLMVILPFRFIMTSLNENIFHVTGHLLGQSTGDRWTPPTEAGDVKLWWFL